MRTQLAEQHGESRRPKPQSAASLRQANGEPAELGRTSPQSMIEPVASIDVGMNGQTVGFLLEHRGNTVTQRIEGFIVRARCHCFPVFVGSSQGRSMNSLMPRCKLATARSWTGFVRQPANARDFR